MTRLLAIVALFVFVNTSFAQNCPNGKCQPQLTYGLRFVAPSCGPNGCAAGCNCYVAPKAALAPKTDCPNGKCPLQAAPATATRMMTSGSACANGNCAAPTTVRRGLFGRVRR